MQNREESYIGLTGIFKNLSQTLFKYVGDLVHLAKLEAELARRSLLRIVVLSFIALILTISAWLGIFFLVVASFLAVGLNLLAALGATIAINIVLLILVAVSILKLKKNLQFSATRKQLSFKKKETKNA